MWRCTMRARSMGGVLRDLFISPTKIYGVCLILSYRLEFSGRAVGGVRELPERCPRHFTSCFARPHSQSSDDPGKHAFDVARSRISGETR
eukprot:5398370-Pyramimonas_sp.AAC.3